LPQTGAYVELGLSIDLRQNHIIKIKWYSIKRHDDLWRTLVEKDQNFL